MVLIKANAANISEEGKTNDSGDDGSWQNQAFFDENFNAVDFNTVNGNEEEIINVDEDDGHGENQADNNENFNTTDTFIRSLRITIRNK